MAKTKLIKAPRLFVERRVAGGGFVFTGHVVERLAGGQVQMVVLQPATEDEMQEALISRRVLLPRQDARFGSCSQEKRWEKNVGNNSAFFHSECF